MSFNNGSIRVTPEELRNASNQLQNGNHQIQSILSNLKNLVDQLGAGWQGQASQAYQDYFQLWQKGANDVNTALENLSRLTSHAAAQFEQSDQQIGGMFRA